VIVNDRKSPKTFADRLRGDVFISAWTQTFQYDGFGNLTTKVLNGTTTPIAVNPATNQLSSMTSYDANGNMTSGGGATLTYDVANRVASANEFSAMEYYYYAPDNKRIYRLNASAEEWTFYGARGERLGVYSLGVSGGFTPLRTNVSFEGTLILDFNNAAYSDRTGSNRASGARFYPYGDEITSTGDDREKFGTYLRDHFTGFDYADQRYYASTDGRFNTADPYSGSIRPRTPLSWNRYSYSGDDPINRNDPTGLADLPTVLKGTILMGGSILAAVATDGGSAVIQTIAGLASAGSFVAGSVFVAEGLTTPAGSRPPATFFNNMNQAQLLMTPGTVFCAAASLGNSRAIGLCAGVSTALSGVLSYSDLINASTTLQTVSAFNGVASSLSDLTDLIIGDPKGPVVSTAPPITIPITDTGIPVEPVPSPTTRELDLSGPASGESQLPGYPGATPIDWEDFGTAQYYLNDFLFY
jgi:RHS repeat-associated protein